MLAASKAVILPRFCFSQLCFCTREALYKLSILDVNGRALLIHHLSQRCQTSVFMYLEEINVAETLQIRVYCDFYGKIWLTCSKIHVHKCQT